MSLSTLLESLTRREDANVASFEDLVRKVATDTKVSVADAAAVLKDSGKNKQDLADGVGRLKERYALAAKLGTATALESERESLQAKIVAEEKKLADARARFEAAVTPLRQRVGEIAIDLTKCKEARRRLMDTIDDGLRAELADAEAARIEAINRLTTLREQAKRLKEAESDREQADLYSNGEAQAERWRQVGDRNEAAGKAALEEIPVVEEALAAAEKTLAAVNVRCLEP